MQAARPLSVLLAWACSDRLRHPTSVCGDRRPNWDGQRANKGSRRGACGADMASTALVDASRLSGVVAVSGIFLYMYYAFMQLGPNARMSNLSEAQIQWGSRAFGNLHEQAPAFLLSLWTYAIFVSPDDATTLGIVWLIFRAAYPLCGALHARCVAMCKGVRRASYCQQATSWEAVLWAAHESWSHAMRPHSTSPNSLLQPVDVRARLLATNPLLNNADVWHLPVHDGWHGRDRVLWRELAQSLLGLSYPGLCCWLAHLLCALPAARRSQQSGPGVFPKKQFRSEEPVT